MDKNQYEEAILELENNSIIDDTEAQIAILGERDEVLFDEYKEPDFEMEFDAADIAEQTNMFVKLRENK